jgi:hypothetical protein
VLKFDLELRRTRAKWLAAEAADMDVDTRLIEARQRGEATEDLERQRERTHATYGEMFDELDEALTGLYEMRATTLAGLVRKLRHFAQELEDHHEPGHSMTVMAKSCLADAERLAGQ